jgi:hypothetical protein
MSNEWSPTSTARIQKERVRCYQPSLLADALSDTTTFEEAKLRNTYVSPTVLTELSVRHVRLVLIMLRLLRGHAGVRGFLQHPPRPRPCQRSRVSYCMLLALCVYACVYVRLRLRMCVCVCVLVVCVCMCVCMCVCACVCVCVCVYRCVHACVCVHERVRVRVCVRVCCSHVRACTNLTSSIHCLCQMQVHPNDCSLVKISMNNCAGLKMTLRNGCKASELSSRQSSGPRTKHLKRLQRWGCEGVYASKK